MFSYAKILVIIGLTLNFVSTQAGGIRGVVKTEDGNLLPYVTIYVKQTSSGAVSDTEGFYSINLKPGHYDLIYSYLGYKSESRSVDIKDAFINIDITLQVQIYQLQSVVVKAIDEDPAYTIMRKAIAKAKYHLQQIDSYTAKVYIKGKGKLTNIPFLAKKLMAKNGITQDRVFITESVNEIKYTRPDKYEQKVIAIYTNGVDREAPANGYVFGSIYQPEIAGTITPFSPKAFSYYKFEYIGSFKDQSYEISKIKVIPRSKGDNVFAGVIYIVEDWWSVHSCDLSIRVRGVNIRMKGVHNCIDEKAWLPVSLQFEVNGGLLGFKFVGNYNALIRNYKIQLNPSLPQEFKVIDEKVDTEKAKEIETLFSKKGQQLQQRLESGKEVTSKELKKLLTEYERNEQKLKSDPTILSESYFHIDSLAYKKDSTFWKEIRPMALTKEERRGYEIADSIAIEEKKKKEGDTLKNKHGKNRFKVQDIIIGNSYKISKTEDFKIQNLSGGFNTVEGVNLIYQVGYIKRWIKNDSIDHHYAPKVSRLEISPIARYAFSRSRLSGQLQIKFISPKRDISLKVGNYVQQYNSDEPIHHIVNTLNTLLLSENYMKLYDQSFIDLKWKEKITPLFSLYAQFNWAGRYELKNNNSYVLIKNEKKTYTPNRPYNTTLANTGFEDNTAFTGMIGVEIRPWQKYIITNGKKELANNESPIFKAEYKKGIPLLNSDVNFDQVEVGAKYQVKFGIRGNLAININAGTFFNTKKMYFIDYKHFMGNRSIINTNDPLASFSLLDYYSLSTADKYFVGHLRYQMRKFLVSRINYVRLMGIKESFSANYLATNASGNYTEFCYSIDGILQFLKLEFATSFRLGKHIDSGFRIGISSRLLRNNN